MLLNLIKSIILGIVEGITEWLPISSTGHLILLGNLLSPEFSEAFMGLFNVLVQLGAIIAVIIVFFNRLWPFHKKENKLDQFAYSHDTGAAGAFQLFANNYLYMDKIILWFKIAVSSIPALIAGLLFEDWLEEHMHKPLPVAVMLIVFGVVIILVENANENKLPRVKSARRILWKDALIIGCFQALALIPGTSRSGAVIVGALIIGLSRTCATRYAFFLAIPAMLGASAIKLLDYEFNFSAGEVLCLFAGMAFAFIISMFVIKLMLRFISRHNFKVFGYYRIALGAVVIAAAALGLIS